MPSPRIEIKLIEKRRLAPNTMELTYERVDGGNIRYVPGQFFSLHFQSAGEEKSRSYSASGEVENLKENTTFSFVISAVPNGAASEYFFAAEPGDQIEMSGPFGALILPMIDPQRYILVATGTGVGPYRTMLPTLKQRMQQNPELEIHLVLGARDRENAVYHDVFESMAEEWPQFSLSLCYSQTLPESARAFEYPGRVNTRFDVLNADPERDMVYLCGNPSMVEEAAEYFKTLDYNPKRLKQEKYNFSTF